MSFLSLAFKGANSHTPLNYNPEVYHNQRGGGIEGDTLLSAKADLLKEWIY